MKLKKLLCLGLVFVVLISSFSGCNKNTQNSATKKFNAKSVAKSIPSQNIAKNDLYSLDWNDEKKCVLFTELSTGRVWSDIPYDYQKTGGTSANVNSTLNITVANSVSLQFTTARGYIDAVNEGRIFCKKIKNGICVTYSFDKYEISVPVKYVLRKDSLLVSIDSAGIREGSSYLLVSVSLAPFLCSARNNTDNSYLFVPTGSGALMYAKETAEIEREYIGEVYGNDATRPMTEYTADSQSVRLPIFGAKDGESAILGIIEKGAGAAFLQAMAGNATTGYSNVYPTFYVRGYDLFDKSSYAGFTDDLIRVSKNITNKKMSVSYYTLSGDNADYNGMAKRYRKYLQDNGAIETEKDFKYSPYNLTFLGGILTTSLVAGVPKKTLKTMTTFSDVESIVSELIKDDKTAPVVRLLGFGESGISYGKLAGGYKFPSQLGNKKSRLSLNEICEKKGINVFYDYDLIRFSKSGSGFSFFNDCAKTAIMKTAEQYPVKVPLREFSDDISYRLITRSKLNKAMDKLIKVSKKNDIKNISVTSLGSIAYSDYSDNSYISKGNIEKDINDMFDSAKKNKLVLASGANAYAASAATVVFDAPTDNGDYFAFDEEIPFYSLVFHGYRSIYSEPVNISPISKLAILKAAVGGCGLSFSLIKRFNTAFLESGTEKLYGMVYDDNKELIKESVRMYKDFYKAVENSEIDRYEKVGESLSKTTFANGIVLYANHSDKPVQTSVGLIEAYGYCWKTN